LGLQARLLALDREKTKEDEKTGKGEKRKPQKPFLLVFASVFFSNSPFPYVFSLASRPRLAHASARRGY
jgi:hypothetical protein